MPLTSDEWNEVKRVFESATQLPREERAPYVQAECANRPLIRNTVLQLLFDHETEASAFRDDTAPLRPRHRAFAVNQLVAGRFRIVRFINRGGMGEVYEACDEKLRTSIALKTLRPELAAQGASLQRFRREIRVAQEVAHDSLCRVFDLIEHRDAETQEVVPCLSMQLLRGESLAQYLTQHRPLPVQTARPLVEQIAAALEALHTKDIIHRDLKPTNIMLEPARDSNLRAVVMDFGLARPVQNDPEIFETRSEFAAGAPYFMAPELLSGDRPSIASDIYSFGLVIDEMVTRSRAFTAETLHFLLFQKLWEKPVPPSARATGLPPVWEAVIQRCIEPEPARRFNRISDVVRALESADPSQVAQRSFRMSRRAILTTSIGLPVFALGAGIASLALTPLRADIVLLPVRNDSGHKEFDALCDLTGPEIARRLANVKGLQVVRWYEQGSAPKKVDGRFVLEGQLNNVGNRLQMLFTLSDSGTGQELWTDGFDVAGNSSSMDLPTLVAQSVTEAVDQAKVFGQHASFGERVAPVAEPLRRFFRAPAAAVAPSPTRSSAAWNQYLQAHQLLDSQTEGKMQAAVELLKGAVKLDPSFALAYADLARAKLYAGDSISNESVDDSVLEEAEDYARHALSADPNLPEAYVAMAAVNQNRWQWANATIYFQKALEIRPKYAMALRWYGGMQVQFAEFDDGLARVRDAITVDPYGWSNYVTAGYLLYMARRFDEAVSVLKPATQGTEALSAISILATIYAWRGHTSSGADRDRWFRMGSRQCDEFTRLAREANAMDLTVDPLQTTSYQLRVQQDILAGKLSEIGPVLDRFYNLADSGKLGLPYAASMLNIGGDWKRALELLERAYVARDMNLMYIRVNPFFDSLGSRSRFQKILRNMGLVSSL